MNVQKIIEILRECNVPVMFRFLDYSKAFDALQSNQLWYILREMAVEEGKTETCAMTTIQPGPVLNWLEVYRIKCVFC